MNLTPREAGARVHLHGPFCVLHARAGYVRCAAPTDGCEFWLRGAGVESADVDRAHALEVAWRDGAVSVGLFLQGTSCRELELRAAAVHAALPGLYAGLPLQRYDVGARRFWRTVFLLVRLPGGRRLLEWLAARER